LKEAAISTVPPAKPPSSAFQEQPQLAAADRQQGRASDAQSEIYAPRIRPGRIAETRISVEETE